MSASNEQLHSALIYCIDFAKEMLSRGGGFLPFGASIALSGEVRAVGGWTGEEHPTPAEVYQLLAESFRSEAKEGNILGAALAVDVNIPGEYSSIYPDGLRVHLEHIDYSRYVYVPYKLKKMGFLRNKHEVHFADPFSVEIAQEFFVGIAP